MRAGAQGCAIMIEAINSAMDVMLARDSNVVVMG